MKWGMEILSPTSSYLSCSSWLDDSKSTKWTVSENKAFENALAVYDKDTPDRWHKVAAMVPGKSVLDVMRQYKELEDDLSSIEAGLIPIPGYSTSPFTLEWGSGNNGYDGFKQPYGIGCKRLSSHRPTEQERKKGVPWTEEEHKTPTQVASHAQKYFIRQLSGGKDKRRASIHDITTVNLNENQTSSPENKRSPSPDQSLMLQQQPNSTAMQKMPFQWNQSNNATFMGFNELVHGQMYSSSPYGLSSNVVKLEEQNLERGAFHDSYFGSQGMCCNGKIDKRRLSLRIPFLLTSIQRARSIMCRCLSL
ncbi:hypothetical protein Leryth_016475 [Lithospermum erythrorhizon]|nr:hypothetical protein Leryth_016475 [Lithospermum erythrorhizon]